MKEISKFMKKFVYTAYVYYTEVRHTIYIQYYNHHRRILLHNYM